MRSFGSSAVTRSMSGLLALSPGTAASDLSSASRVSNDTPPLYLPLVWHSAQRDLSSGSTSWAKSTGPAARTGAAHAAATTAKTVTYERNDILTSGNEYFRPGRFRWDAHWARERTGLLVITTYATARRQPARRTRCPNIWDRGSRIWIRSATPRLQSPGVAGVRAVEFPSRLWLSVRASGIIGAIARPAEVADAPLARSARCPPRRGDRPCRRRRPAGRVPSRL